MKLLMITIALLAGGAHAQVYKCNEGGKIVYAQAPCAGAGEAMRPGQLSGNSAGRVQRETPAEAPPPSAAVIPGAAKCLDAQGIKNVETSASSRLQDKWAQKVHAEQVQLARACKPLMSPDEMKARGAQLRHESLAARRSAPGQSEGPTQLVGCDGAGCWDTSGNRYNNAAGGNFTRSDGKFCVRGGSTVQCN